MVALIGVVTGGLAPARSAGRMGTGNGRNGAIVALVLGLIGMVLAGLHLAHLSRWLRHRRGAGARFRNDILAGPGGKQILLQDPSGNVVELFQPATR